ncbi:MAG: T9SS type A sorting domain-containing protein [Bacteroidota bacterium]|nr:T9SS type A sorting domain-containing protein [Bacteroidota bacterium]
MKKIITLLFVAFTNLLFSQVNCDLTYTRTLSGFDVYIHNPSGATMYRAKFYIDADGSPRAYGPNNSGLDWTANAGYPGNWWALITDTNGDPILQGPTDPYPGMYVCATSLADANYGLTNPLRYVNSETVPYIAMPTNVLADGGIIRGDVAYVYNTVTGQSCFAIYADAGNNTSIGEGSIYLASQIGVDPDVRTGGTSSGIIDYVVFPNSGFGQGYIPTIHEIDSIGNLYLNRAVVGGACIVSCIGSVFDQTAPTSVVSVPPMWDTTNFIASFADADNGGCGGTVAKRFYQVADYDANNEWRANNTHGFFNDDFVAPAINADWTTSTGTWILNAGNYLEQTDEVLSNTNIYAPLTQDLSDEYLYNWTGTLGGAGTNRRAGFHFFADQPALSERGNSYFVYFRLDNDKVQIYEVVNNSWGSTFVAESDYDFNANQAYDFKVLYNRINGLVTVYVNNTKVLSWTDTTPLTTGSHVSFRSANCTYKVDNFKVFRSRTSSENISVGSGNTNDIRYQNQDQFTPAGKISSVVTDMNGNISTAAMENINVDFTSPSTVSSINDGSTTDIDTTFNGTQLKANWANSADVNSGLVGYYYAIGTTPGGSNIVPWTNNGSNTSVTEAGLSLVHLQTYYVSVQAENGALMNSSVITSDGQIYFNNAVGIESLVSGNSEIRVYPNPTSGQFTISTKQFSGETTIRVIDVLGKEILTNLITGTEVQIDLSQQGSGLYYVMLVNNGKQYCTKVQVNK